MPTQRRVFFVVSMVEDSLPSILGRSLRTYDVFRRIVLSPTQMFALCPEFLPDADQIGTGIVLQAERIAGQELMAQVSRLARW